MLITPLFVRSSFLLKVIVLSTNAYYHIAVRLSFLLKVIMLSTDADYLIVCPFVPFYLRLLCCPPMLITPLFVRSSFLLRLLCCPPMFITQFFVHSSFLLNVNVLSINVDHPIVCPFVLFT